VKAEASSPKAGRQHGSSRAVAPAALKALRTASPASLSSPGVDDLDTQDVAVGTKVVLRPG